MKSLHTLFLLLCFSFLFSSLSTAQTLQNPGFEDIDIIGTDTLLNNWTQSFAQPTDDAHSGNSAIYTWNWYYYAQGYFINGNHPDVAFNLIRGGTPVSSKPSHLNGYYKYDLGHNGGAADSARVIVIMKKWNSIAESHDTIGYIQAALPAQEEYAPFSIAIPDWAAGVNPDSIVIAFYSSQSGFCDTNSLGNCCFLYVDDLNLSFATGTVDITDWFTQLKAWPNPTTGTLNLSWNADPQHPMTDAVLMDLMGRKVFEWKIPSAAFGNMTLDIDHITSGQYILEIKDQAGRRKSVKVSK